MVGLRNEKKSEVEAILKGFYIKGMVDSGSNAAGER